MASIQDLENELHSLRGRKKLPETDENRQKLDASIEKKGSLFFLFDFLIHSLSELLLLADKNQEKEQSAKRIRSETRHIVGVDHFISEAKQQASFLVLSAVL